MNDLIKDLLEGNNYPVKGSVSFDSSDHIRFQNGVDVSGHNYGCNRRFVIEKNIEGGEGYTVTMYNLDGLHPIWQNNIQMAPKRMKIVLEYHRHKTACPFRLRVGCFKTPKGNSDLQKV